MIRTSRTAERFVTTTPTRAALPGELPFVHEQSRALARRLSASQRLTAKANHRDKTVQKGDQARAIARVHRGRSSVP